MQLKTLSNIAIIIVTFQLYLQRNFKVKNIIKYITHRVNLCNNIYEYSNKLAAIFLIENIIFRSASFRSFLRN